MFRDPDLLHNKLYADAYKQQAKRDEDRVFADFVEVDKEVNRHLALSRALYREYQEHIRKNEFAQARQRRFSIEAHQREASRLVEKLPEKFNRLSQGTVKRLWSTFKRTVANYSHLENWTDFGKNLETRVNEHGSKIKKEMHLADIAEDDFYRRGLEATRNFFIQDRVKADARKTLITNATEKIASFDAREREALSSEKTVTPPLTETPEQLSQDEQTKEEEEISTGDTLTGWTPPPKKEEVKSSVEERTPVLAGEAVSTPLTTGGEESERGM